LDTFVEVQLDGNDSWAGLTLTGDVFRSSTSRKANSQFSGRNIATLGRTSYQFIGAWLTMNGEIIMPGHRDPLLEKAFSGLTLRDLSYCDPGVWAGLKQDGSVVFHGKAIPAPLPYNDFVRIEATDDTTFGIRENGQIECWGPRPAGFDEMQQHRFVKMSADGQYLLALTEDGALWQAHTSKAHPVQHIPVGTGPVIDMRAGLNMYVARRASDRRWVAWNGHGVTSPKIESIIEKVATLGPNVESLYCNGIMPALVWIETK